MREKINIMFIGLGSIGQRHLRNLKKILKNNVRFFAFRKSRYTPLLDFNGKKIKGNVEEKYGISVTPNLNLVNKKIHIIFITNPTSLHIATVLKFGAKKILAAEMLATALVADLHLIPATFLYFTGIHVPLAIGLAVGDGG